MLFDSTLKKFESSVQVAVKELFDTAYQNQTHPQDLLLVLENGFFWKENVEALKRLKMSPYTIGPGTDGYSAQTQYRFYDSYRHNIEQDRENFINKSQSEENRFHIVEENSIHLEFMIYLKFWEAEQVVKRLYQLSRLCRGLEYDWHFNIELFSNGRQQIIREYVRDPLEDICPNFFVLIKSIYNNQIRNAIAHSQFAFVSRNINLNNKHLSRHYRLHNLTFEEWEEKIHQLVLLYNEIIRHVNDYYTTYIQKSILMHYGLPLRITLPDKSTKSEFYKYDQGRERWSWYNNIKSG